MSAPFRIALSVSSTDIYTHIISHCTIYHFIVQPHFVSWLMFWLKSSCALCPIIAKFWKILSDSIRNEIFIDRYNFSSFLQWSQSTKLLPTNPSNIPRSVVGTTKVINRRFRIMENDLPDRYARRSSGSWKCKMNLTRFLSCGICSPATVAVWAFKI